MKEQVRLESLVQIPSTIWMMGFITLLINLSSIMIFSLSPLYLTQVFGLALFSLGIFEGVLEFFSWVIRIFSGLLSDYMRRRKPLLIIAYSMAFISRPVFVMASQIGWVYAAKMMDRIANGLQATPREALVGDAAPKHLTGTCFGLRQSLGLIGSLLGAFAVMYLMRLTEKQYVLIFWVAAIPPLLALLVLFLVKETPLRSFEKHEKLSFNRETIGECFKKILQFDSSFWKLMTISGVYMCSNYSGAYRILQAERIGFPLEDVSIILIIQNLGAMISAYPVGRLSDLFDQRLLLAIGFVTTVLANIFFGLINGKTGILIGSALWGIQMGITQSILLSMVASNSGPFLRGTAFGIYYLVTAFGLFIANAIMGWVFESYGAFFAFITSSFFVCVSGVLLLLSRTYLAKNESVVGFRS